MFKDTDYFNTSRNKNFLVEGCRHITRQKLTQVFFCSPLLPSRPHLLIPNKLSLSLMTKHSNRWAIEAIPSQTTAESMYSLQQLSGWEGNRNITLMSEPLEFLFSGWCLLKEPVILQLKFLYIQYTLTTSISFPFLVAL